MESSDYRIAGENSSHTFPFLKLPRELRDQIYDYVFALPDPRGDRALCIERRNLRYFQPSAAAVLLTLHHEQLLLNRQVAREALEILFKDHVVFLSCGPFVLRSLLARMEEHGVPCKHWLKWLKNIELDWVTFPNLRSYPPNREKGKDEWWWEQDEIEVDIDYIRGAQYSGHYDENDYEGGHYDDNLYEPENSTLYPSFSQPTQTADPDDPFGFGSHYPFSDPDREPTHNSESQEEVSSKLELLVQLEVTPLFDYLASPTFALSSITLPLYFISKQSFHQRNSGRPGYGLPAQIRYWVFMCVHALMMLTSTSTSSPLDQVHVKYLPWDIWASMDSTDELRRMEEKGVLFNTQEDLDGGREGEGEAFRAIWAELQEKGLCTGTDRMGLDADARYVKWEGDLGKPRVGDELEVFFTRG